MAEKSTKRRLRSQFWFDNPDNPGMTALYLARYLNLGFIFGEGAFQAVDQSPQHRGLQEFSVGPPAESNVAVAFARTGKPLLVLDLRALPKRGPVHDWFVAPHPTREIGASFLNDKAMTGLLALPERFDGVIFVEKTTRARPVKKP